MRLPVLSLLLLVPLVGSLLLVNWQFPATVWWRAVQDFGHVPLFAVIAVAIYSYWRFPPRGTGQRALALAIGLAIVIGAMTELLQTMVGRNGSWGDFRHDLAGIAIGAFGLAAIDPWLAPSRRVRVAAATLAFTTLAIAIVPVVQMYRAYAYRNANFPELARFRDAREHVWIHARGARREIRDDALMIEFGDDQYPGVSWHEPVPDWRGFRQLVLEMSNPNDRAIEVTLRVHDVAHNREYADRFNRAIVLQPRERREIAVALDALRRAPAGREMDLRQISDVSLFRSGAAGPRALRVHRLGLER